MGSYQRQNPNKRKANTTRRDYRRKRYRSRGIKLNMKQLPIILIMLLLIIGCFWAYDFNNKMAPIWEAEAQYELQQKIREDERAQAARYARAKWWEENTERVYSGIALTGFAIAGLAIWFVYDKRREAHNRPIDGTFALKETRVGGQKMLVNPNLQPTAILALGDNRASDMPAQAAWMLQDKALANQGKTALAQAMVNVGLPRTIAGGKYLAGAFDRPQQQQAFKVLEDETPLLEAQPVKRFEFGEAIAQSDKFNWVVGQESDTEELMRFNFTKQSHALVCGSTNCGKTSSTGYLLALMALKSKMHVCIFDGAGGADWMPFERFTEFKLVQPEDLAFIIDRIEELYNDRQEELKSAGVADNYQLKPPLQPIIILLDEVGFLLAGLEKKAKEDAVKRLTRAIRVIRKVGIHLVLIDQNVQSLPSQLLTNINCIFAYKAEGMASNAIKRYNLDKLKPQGQFDYNGRVTDAWHTAKFLDEHLNGLRPVKQKFFFNGSTASKSEGVSGDEIDAKYTLTSSSGSSGSLSDKAVLNGSTVVLNGSDNDSKNRKLNGEPLSETDRELVYTTFKSLNSKTAACKEIWGYKNGKSMSWLNAVIEETEEENVTA